MLYKRQARVPPQSFFLLGMRGVGKSTWVRQALPDALRLDLLDEALFIDLLAEPSLFRQLLSGVGSGQWVVVDEIQRIPSLLNEVHRLIEERGTRFALLGSSARKLKTSGTNLLAGRALRKAMHPLTAAELGDDFSLDEALRYGTIPLIWAAPDRREALQSYTQLYLREEIRAEAAVRNLSGFMRFLPVAAVMHGQNVNTASVARDAGVARSTVNGYFEILDDTLLAVQLPAFEAKLRTRERRRPKLYWADPGLVRAVKRQLGPVAGEERGALLEGWVLEQLRAHNEHQRIYDDVGYWAAAESSAEVDFMLTRDGEHLAVEVKAAERYNNSMLKGLRAVAGLSGLSRRILVYRGLRAFSTEDGIEVWPIDRLHEALRSDRLWP
ncbi:MAG: ATP-binding protein [Acidimicrobiaceae bacterium]|nr:ATP-binding protein [Acidimicrobiaceae bacterium]MCY4293238.1 ATP-binding protein [Acidimicrobiaceae bacterium]